jgi:hypothetical protein
MNTIPPISLPNDLSIYHSDIHEYNFLINVATGRIWIVDFQHIGVLPKAFQQYSFFNIDSPLARNVGNFLGQQQSDIVKTMAEASAMLVQIGDGSLSKHPSNFIRT